MAIDPKEIRSIEDSMVHDLDESPHPEGWGIYATLRFLSRIVLAVYGLILLGTVTVQALVSSPPMLLRPEPALIALPMAVVAAYLYLTSEPEPQISRKRTPFGKVVTFVAVYVGMQVVTLATWIALFKAFSLR